MERHYLIIKEQISKKCNANCNNLDGYVFKPLNNIEYLNSVTITKMILYKPSFIEKVLKKKIRNKLNLYLQIIINSIDDDDESNDPVNVRAALNDLTRYRNLVINNYRKYLESKYVEILLTKISMIEQELKNKLVYLLYQEKPEEKQVDENKRSR